MHSVDDRYRKYSVVGFLFAVTTALIVSILPIYLKELGYSNTDLGFIFSLFPLAIIFTIPIIGHIADKIGKKKIIILAILAEIVAFSFYIIADNMEMIIISRLLDGIAVTTLTMITIAKVEDVIKKKRGTMTGNYLSLKYIGTMIAAPFSIFIADFFFIKSPFFLSIGIMILLFFFLFNKKDIHFKKLHGKDFNYFENIKKFLSHTKLRAIAFLGITMHAAYLPFHIFLPLFVIENLNEPLTSVGYLLFLYQAPFLLQFIFGRLSDMKNPKSTILLGVLIYAAGIMSIFFVQDIISLGISVVVMGLGASMWNVSMLHMMSNIGEKIRNEGLVITSYVGLSSIGAFVASMLSGIIVETYSFQTFSLYIGAIIILASIIAYTLLRK